MNVTDYAYSGSSIFVEINDCQQAGIPINEFFDFHCEANAEEGWTCNHDLQVIRVPFSLPRIDKARATVFSSDQGASITTYEQFINDKSSGIEDLLRSFCEALQGEIQWAEVDVEDIAESDAMDYRKFRAECV